MPLKVGHHRPASETQLKWRFAGVPIHVIAHHCMLAWYICSFVFLVIRTSIARKPYIFVICLGGGSGPPVPTFGYAYCVVYLLNKSQ